MGCPKRFIVVGHGFLGLLFSIGFRAVFAMVMVDVIKSGNGTEPETNSLFKKCTVNANDTSTNVYLSLKGVTVQLSQYMNTAYFFGSLLTQVPGGYLATRFSPSRICGLSILISSLLMLTLPWAIPLNKWLTMAIRLAQGIVEGVSVPALNGVISAWAPKSEKTRMITISYAGAYLSPTVAFLVTGSTSCYLSWNASLFIYGVCGVLWTISWFIFIYDTPTVHPNVDEAEKLLFEEEGARHKGGNKNVALHIPWRGVLSSLPMYAIIVGSFCRNWIFSLVITELPQYFRDVFHASIAEIGWMTAAPEVFMTLITVIGGVLIEKMISAKKSYFTTTRGRKLAQCAGFGSEAICFLVLATRGNSDTDQITAVILLCVGVGFSGLAISGYQVNPLDLAPQYASILTGLSRCGALGAILSTALAATLRGRSEDVMTTWQTIFWVAGAIHMAGVVFYGVFAQGTRQPWAEVDDETKPLVNPTEDHFTGSDSDSGLSYAHRERIFSSSVEYGSTSGEIEEDLTDSDRFSKSVDYGAGRRRRPRKDVNVQDWFLLAV